MTQKIDLCVGSLKVERRKVKTARMGGHKGTKKTRTEKQGQHVEEDLRLGGPRMSPEEISEVSVGSSKIKPPRPDRYKTGEGQWRLKSTNVLCAARNESEEADTRFRFEPTIDKRGFLNCQGFGIKGGAHSVSSSGRRSHIKTDEENRSLDERFGTQKRKNKNMIVTRDTTTVLGGGAQERNGAIYGAHEKIPGKMIASEKR